MTKQEAKERFEKRLDREYLSEFENGTLFAEGRTLYWENLNGVFDITVLSFDGIKVKFRINTENRTEEFTLDNLFIFNKTHLKKLYDESMVYDSEKSSLDDFIHLDFESVYVIHNKKCDDKSGYYVGQAKNGSWRIKDHLQNAKNMIKHDDVNSGDKEAEIESIDAMLGNGMKYTLKFIPLKESGYTNLDALEACFIAYFNSFKTGYNKTRGNNGPGDKK